MAKKEKKEKKNKKKAPEQELSPEKKTFRDNVRTLKDCFAPSEINVIDPSTLQVGEKFVRNYVMQGYPSYVQVGWLDSLYNYQGDVDTIVMAEPVDDRVSVEELTKQIVALQAQYAQEQREGKISNLQAYADKIAMLEAQRRRTELNEESMVNVGIFANLTANSKEDLDKRGEILEADMKGRRANLLPTHYRMLNGYKTALPLNFNAFEDKLRNFTSGALVSCIPYIRGEICHPSGIWIGVNEHTGNNVMIDFYDKKIINNTNISIFGRAGSGKTFLTYLMTMRSGMKGIYSAIIDPEGEYGGIVKALGGIEIELSAASKSMINIFEVNEEERVDDDGNPTGEYFVNIREKVSDLLDFICVCATEVSSEERSLISSVIIDLYRRFGITEDPESLYDKTVTIDPITQEIYPNGKLKRMPQFSDFYELLSETIDKMDKTDAEYTALKKMQNKLRMYCQGQAYPLFDCQSTVNLENLQNAPLVSFNIAPLEAEGNLRPVGMYVAMSYIWDKLIKKNYHIRKRVICDEAWMMLNESFPGHEYTSAFLEKCARRIRKRNAGLMVASQNFIEFTSSNAGKAVLNQTAVKMFLKQNETDIDALQEMFKVSNGERNFLLRSQTGEVLIKTDNESAVCAVVALPIEQQIIKQAQIFQKKS